MITDVIPFLVGVFLVPLNRMTLVFHCKYFICLQNVIPALTCLQNMGYMYLIISLSFPFFFFFVGGGMPQGSNWGPQQRKHGVLTTG